MRRFLLALLAFLISNAAFAAEPYHGAMVRKALVNGTLNSQIIPNNAVPYPVLIFDQVVYDTENCFDPSDSSFIVPVGMNYARISVQATWGNSGNGNRQLVILRKSPRNTNPNAYEFFTGDPVATQVANVQTDQSTQTPGAIPVVPGEHYAAFPYQTSGAALDIMGGTGTAFGIQFWQ